MPKMQRPTQRKAAVAAETKLAAMAVPEGPARNNHARPFKARATAPTEPAVMHAPATAPTEPAQKKPLRVKRQAYVLTTEFEI